MTIMKLCGSQQTLIPFFFLFPNGQILLEAMRESFICNDIQTGAAAANKLLPDPHSPCLWRFPHWQSGDTRVLFLLLPLMLCPYNLTRYLAPSTK